MSRIFSHAILGGTFDHFHAGHRDFLDAALTQAKHVTIGISTDVLVKDKLFAQSIEGYYLREQQVKKYIEEKDMSAHVTIVSLDGFYDQDKLNEQSIDAIFVTQDNIHTALLINEDREKRGLQTLTIVSIPLKTGDDRKTISSARIRSGEINREGNSYYQFFQKKKEYLLPQVLRSTLQEPIGTQCKNIREVEEIVMKNSLIISVGDIVSSSILQADFTSLICFVDLKTRREPLKQELVDAYFASPSMTIKNEPGKIDKQVAEVLQSAFDKLQQTKKNQIVLVEGEEDLLALPCLLLAPLDSYVIYGQYDIGLVVVKITEEQKEFAKQLLGKF